MDTVNLGRIVVVTGRQSIIQYVFPEAWASGGWFLVAVKRKLKSLMEYYSAIQKKRVVWFSWKWRVIVILLSVSISAMVYDLLENRYFFWVETPVQAFLLSDKLFSWFMTGFLFGILTLGLLYEGELLINWRRLFRDLENEAETLIGLKPVKKKRKQLKKKKRK